MTTVEVVETVNSNAQSVWDILGNFGGLTVGGPITAFSVEGLSLIHISEPTRRS